MYSNLSWFVSTITGLVDLCNYRHAAMAKPECGISTLTGATIAYREAHNHSL